MTSVPNSVGRAAGACGAVRRRAVGSALSPCAVPPGGTRPPAGFHARPPAALHLACFRLLCLLALALPLGLPAEDFAEPAPLAARGLLLDITAVGGTLVAVGDHGHVLISRDHGVTWSQGRVPTRVLLTGVSFPDQAHGWVVGHDGVILATADGGLSWQRQDDGKQTDTVWLDVLFLDVNRGFAVGAYGKFSQTVDGGKTWTLAKPTEDEVHFNRITAGDDGHLYLAGEGGLLLVSADGGQSWTKSEVPYDGSLFGVLPVAKGLLVTYGLRGHILVSEDHGVHWEPRNSAVKVLIMGGVVLHDGALLLGGQGGNFFLSRDAGRTFQPWKSPGFGTSIADLVATDDGWLVTVGEAGVVRIKQP